MLLCWPNLWVEHNLWGAVPACCHVLGEEAGVVMFRVRHPRQAKVAYLHTGRDRFYSTVCSSLCIHWFQRQANHIKTGRIWTVERDDLRWRLRITKEISFLQKRWEMPSLFCFRMFWLRRGHVLSLTRGMCCWKEGMCHCQEQGSLFSSENEIYSPPFRKLYFSPAHNMPFFNSYRAPFALFFPILHWCYSFTSHVLSFSFSFSFLHFYLTFAIFSHPVFIYFPPNDIVADSPPPRGGEVFSNI
jgi:hypothetical protein